MKSKIRIVPLIYVLINFIGIFLVMLGISGMLEVYQCLTYLNSSFLLIDLCLLRRGEK